MNNKFVLPKEWHIIPKNYVELRIIGKWFDESEFAFPNDKIYYQNLDLFYIGQAFGGVDKGDVLHNRIGTEITFEDFKKYVLKEETMEKISIEKLKKDTEYVVYIDSEEEWEELNKLCGFKVTTEFCGKHCYSPSNNTYSCSSSRDNPGSYTYKGELSKIITISQIDQNMDRKIIGYKVPFDINSVIKKGAILTKYADKYCEKQFRGHGMEYYLTAQLVEQWEPVYEEEIKLPTINGYTGRVDGNLIIYGPNCAKFAINNIKDLCEDILSFNNPDEGLSNYRGGNRTITSVKLSSGVEITIEQLTKINDYLESTLNK